MFSEVLCTWFIGSAHVADAQRAVYDLFPVSLVNLEATRASGLTPRPARQLVTIPPLKKAAEYCAREANVVNFKHPKRTGQSPILEHASDLSLTSEWVPGSLLGAELQLKVIAQGFTTTFTALPSPSDPARTSDQRPARVPGLPGAFRLVVFRGGPPSSTWASCSYGDDLDRNGPRTDDPPLCKPC
uniref:Uncharacterized protein n=1 Tax=Branchiostoma floridae TaxID=7739 RepID=C3ZC68_BRAFL|eukprot:XP_002593829.1 hypothetical protein BRAFLDRAFT_75712 [Branchiostoma floridae]